MRVLNNLYLIVFVHCIWAASVLNDAEDPIDSETDAVVISEDGEIHKDVQKISAEEFQLIQSGKHLQNPHEMSGQYEGDIVLPPPSVTRNGLRSTVYRWPRKRVPYVISTSFSYNQAQSIETALRTIESVSCVRFIKRTNERDYVRVTAYDNGCYSNIGYYNSGEQYVNLQRNGCMSQATIVHEFLHLLGFYHMQASYDRDNYVIINWNNIQTNQQYNFNKLSSNLITDFGYGYDLNSIMHYTAYAFSKNNYPTITPRDNRYFNLIGRGSKMTSSDIKRLNKMYTC